MILIIIPVLICILIIIIEASKYACTKQKYDDPKSLNYKYGFKMRSCFKDHFKYLATFGNHKIDDTYYFKHL